MKRLFIILAVILPLLSACGGRSLKDIRVDSVEIVSLTPHGLRDIDAVVRFTVHNPSMGFELTDVLGKIKFKGQEAVTISADQLIVAGNADKTYTVPIHGTISDDFNPFKLLGLVNGRGGEPTFNLDDLSVDLSLRRALRGGIGTTVVKKDIRISDFIEKK